MCVTRAGDITLAEPLIDGDLYLLDRGDVNDIIFVSHLSTESWAIVHFTYRNTDQDKPNMWYCDCIYGGRIAGL